MENKEFREFIKGIDVKTMLNICHQYFSNNPRYIARFTEDQIEVILDCILYPNIREKWQRM